MNAHSLAFKAMQALNGVKYLYDQQVEGVVEYAAHGHVITPEVKKEAASMVRTTLKQLSTLKETEK